MPGFHHSIAVLPLLFRRRKIPFSYAQTTDIGNVSGNGVRKRQRLTGMERKNGNGTVETGHKFH